MNKVTKLRMVKGEFGNRDLGNVVMVQPMRDAPKQKEAKHDLPEVVMRDPRSIGIDPDFQRNISDRGKTLIGDMVEEWDWAVFQMPAIYFDEDRGVEMAFDGQHTLIGAATREDILSVPCTLYQSVRNAKDAASAFVERNGKRLGVTPLQRYKAALFAGHGWALKIDELAHSIGFNIPLYASDAEKPDNVVCIVALKQMLELRGEQGLRQIMKALVGCAIAPIRDAHIKAIDMLFNTAEYEKLIRKDRLRGVIRSQNNNVVLREAIGTSIATGQTRAQALANIYLREYQGMFGVQ